MLLVVVIYSFGQRSFSGVEVGILYAFVSYIARVVDPLIQITLQFGQIQQAVVSAARVNTFVTRTADRKYQYRCTNAVGDVNIAHLSFAYSAGHPVLQDVNLHVPAGSFFGVVGHTGSGKSTLMSLLLRFYSAQSGSIRIDGHDIAAADEHFRASVGLVPQEP